MTAPDHEADDEALARFLQYEEQHASQQPQPLQQQHQHQQQHHTPNNTTTSDTQESRDLALAREMMEMEWKQHGHSAAAVAAATTIPQTQAAVDTTSSLDAFQQQQQQQQQAHQETTDFEMARRIQAQEELLSQTHAANTLLSATVANQQQTSTAKTSRPFVESSTTSRPFVESSTIMSGMGTVLSDTTSTSMPASTTDPLLTATSNTAMGIPEAAKHPQEQPPTTFESNDQRLAWLMESTGRSLRDLQSEDDLLPKVLQQPTRKSTTVAKKQRKYLDDPHRRPSRTEPSSPLRSTQQQQQQQQHHQHHAAYQQQHHHHQSSFDWGASSDDAASCSTATSKSAPTSPRAKSPLRQYQQQQQQQSYYPSIQHQHHRSSSATNMPRGVSHSPTKRRGATTVGNGRPKVGSSSSSSNMTMIPMGIPPPPSISGMTKAGTPPSGIPPAPAQASGLPSILLSPSAGIPAAIPPPPMGGRKAPKVGEGCAKCGLTSGTFLKAMDKVYHLECFRCYACGEKIDAMSKFIFKEATSDIKDEGGTDTPCPPTNTTGGTGKKTLHPYHAECNAMLMAKESPCVVCQNPIPTNAHGGMLFIKHPFFKNERMCPDHVNPTDGNPTCRRCTGCRRFEPHNARFVDLGDGHRCVCFSCVRTVIMDGAGVDPLWQRLVHFFENVMNLPVPDDFRTLPVLLVGQGELHEHQTTSHSIHAQSPHLMSRGLTLVDKVASRRSSGRRKLKVPTMQFNFSTSSFESSDHSSAEGYKYIYLPSQEQTTTFNKVVCIMCMSGLPRDLTACILAHEATHAWLHLHPERQNQQASNNHIDLQVEEGVAQLVAMLFLTQGLEKTTPPGPDDSGPTDNDLRRYFQYSIESDESEIFGMGYRKAAHAYQEVGIVALLTHVVRYGTFPEIPS